MPRLTSEKWKLELCGGLCPALQSYLLPVPLPVHQGDGPHLGAQQEGRMGAGGGQQMAPGPTLWRQESAQLLGRASCKFNGVNNCRGFAGDG